MFTFHHCIVDQWSVRLFFQELASAYRVIDRSDWRHRCRNLPVQYADYASWQRRRLTGERRQRSADYWRVQLADLALGSSSFPRTGRGPSGRAAAGAVHEFRLDGPAVTTLRRLAREESTTLFTLLLAGFRSGSVAIPDRPTFVVVTPVADRERPEVQSMIGYFLNTVPIRVRLDTGASFRETLRHVTPDAPALQSHMPTCRLNRSSNWRGTVARAETRRSTRSCLCCSKSVSSSLKLDPARGRPLRVHTATAQVPISRSTSAHKRRVGVPLGVCHRSVQPRSRGPDGRSSDRAIARRSPRDPDDADRPAERDTTQQERQSDLSGMEPYRQATILANVCVHELFEEQVARTPDAVAVEFGGQSMSYQELNQRADRLHASLACHGGWAGGACGPVVERSFERIIGLLGILKAGGAIWAGEEDLPGERLRHAARACTDRECCWFARMDAERAWRIGMTGSTDRPAKYCHGRCD